MAADGAAAGKAIRRMSGGAARKIVMIHSDKHLVCVDCRTEFTFASGEQKR